MWQIPYWTSLSSCSRSLIKRPCLHGQPTRLGQSICLMHLMPKASPVFYVDHCIGRPCPSFQKPHHPQDCSFQTVERFGMVYVSGFPDPWPKYRGFSIIMLFMSQSSPLFMARSVSAVFTSLAHTTRFSLVTGKRFMFDIRMLLPGRYVGLWILALICLFVIRKKCALWSKDGCCLWLESPVCHQTTL